MKDTLIENLHGEEVYLRPGKTHETAIRIGEYSASKKYGLYFTGEAQFGMLWRTEPDFEHFYMLVEDALNTEQACRSRYCLDLSAEETDGKKIGYVKRAVRKLRWPPAIMDVPTVNYTDDWEFGIRVKTEGLSVEEGGYLRFAIETWENIDPALTVKNADRRYEINIPQGDHDWTRLSEIVRIPKKETSCAIVSIEGTGYSGKVYFECPFLISADGYNVLPDFGTAVQNEPTFEWFGCNLSKKDWPTFRLCANGREFFNGEKFEGCHRFSDFEFDIPAELLREGENRISIQYTASYHDAAPFRLGEIRFLEREGGGFEIVNCPETATVGKDIPVFIETYEPDLQLEFEGESPLVCRGDLFFAEAGLHVLQLSCGEICNDRNFTLRANGTARKGTVKRICRHTEDGVITGTGDAICVNFDLAESAERFLKWYFSEKIGNLLTIRPIYRWGGTRTVNAEVWKSFVSVLNGNGCKYDLMSDGRDLPGLNQNPSPALLEGEHFLGVQIHERDGQLTYWSRNPVANFTTQDVFFDLVMKMARESPETTFIPYHPGNFKSANGRAYLRRDMENGADSEKLALGIVKQLSDMKLYAVRHTGPTVYFKYFFQAGFRWTGAETMYSATEPLIAFLRGAAKAYGQPSFGIHAALQWSTRPHNTEQRYRRYRLALYVPYMLGVTEINTEEGLYRLECGYQYFDRYSDACRAHLKEHQDFYRYLSTHSRTGTFYTPFAFLHGRYDGWIGFNRSERAWGMPYAPRWESEDGWNLLKVFYPASAVNDRMAGCSYCIDRPLGCYTSTPYGHADAMPVEQGSYEGYKLLSFAGYNKADPADFERIYAHIRRGNTLIVGLPHLSDTTALEDIRSYRLTFDRQALGALPVTIGKFSEETVGGAPVRVSAIGYDEAKTKVLRVTDQGTPLVLELKLGAGRVLLVNALEYPGNPSIYGVYEQLLREEAEKTATAEDVWVECDDTAEFSVFRQEDGSAHVYLLAMDWYRDPTSRRRAFLRVGKERYEVSFPFGRMLKIVVSDRIAAWVDSEEGEVLAVRDGSVEVQGYGKMDLFVARNGSVTKTTLDFTDEAVQRIAF